MSVWNSASLVAQYIKMQKQLLIFLHIPARIGDTEPGLIAEYKWQPFPGVRKRINCLSFVTSFCLLVSSGFQTDEINDSSVHVLLFFDLAPV